jgi:hypothetical protein
LLPLVFFIHSIGANVAYALSGDNYADILVDKANKLELYNDRYWQILLHYKTGLFGKASLIDDPDFFLSENGKKDPRSELEATIRSFFHPPVKSKKHPICRFAARFCWLKEKLSMDLSRLPLRECDAFNKMIQEIKPVSASLIFPASHMNNPASMFGHTLLTIETENRTKLLSYAINYAAVTPETFGLTYAVKGLFGFYEGYYSIQPYYTKLQEYSDISHRDIWEYRLNLTRDEVVRMLLHLYELDHIYSDYFFFDENCSYALLFLLDAARPERHLTDQIKWWVIPVDTVKLAKENNLIVDVAYRPSKTSKIKHLAGLVSEEAQNEAISVATGHDEPEALQLKPTDPIERIRTADLAIEYLQYRYAQKKITKEAYLGIFMPSLNVRSAMGNVDTDRPEIVDPVPPDRGHDANRLRLGFGFREDITFQEIRFRPANHDLLDNDNGYEQGAQIEFLDTSLRYYFSKNQLKIDYIDLVDIVSITPRDRFFRPFSWKIATGFQQKLMADENEALVAYFGGGGGVAYNMGFLGLWYTMAVGEINLGGELQGDCAVGLGIKTGIIKTVGDNLKCHFYVHDTAYGMGDRHNEFEGALAASYSLANNTAVGAKISRTVARNFYLTEGCIYANIFF